MDTSMHSHYSQKHLIWLMIIQRTKYGYHSEVTQVHRGQVHGGTYEASATLPLETN